MKKELRFVLLIILGFVLVGAFVGLNHSDKETKKVLINEVCSHNGTVIYDDYGYYADYVELYNNSEAEIDLSNYYLSDKEEELNLYNIQENIVLPGEYAVVFINKEESGFAIGDEDTLYLVNMNGNIEDVVTLPIMDTDMVYARNAYTYQWESDQAASPGMANTIEKEVIKRLNNVAPRLSVESGFYSEPFYLEISADKKYDVYYTLDGSTPTEDSIYYEGPILIENVSSNSNVYSAIKEISVDEDHALIAKDLIDKCNIVRAVAIAPDGARSEEVYGSYFVGFEEKYGYGETYILSLITDPENLFSEETGIYVYGNLAKKHGYTEDYDGNGDKMVTNYSREGKGWRKSAYAQLFSQEGEVLYEQPIEISIHGNHTVKYAQKGFNLLGVDNKDNKYVFQGLFGDNTSLMLRSGGTIDWKRTQFRDNLNHTLVEDRDITTLQVVPCQVFLDGEYWGLYNLQERIDRGLIADKYGVKEEDVIVFKNENVIGADDSYYEMYSSMVEYARNHDLSKQEYYDEITKMIDIQSYIDYFCFQIYVAACDSVGNNYSCWRTKNISTQDYYDGRWRLVMYDTDDATGAREDFTLVDVDSFSGGHISIAPMQDLLFVSLMENGSFKRQFVSTFVEMADTNFEPNHVNEVIDDLSDKYMEASTISHMRYGREESEEAYTKNVDVIKDFFANRRLYIMEHLENNLGIEDVTTYLAE